MAKEWSLLARGLVCIPQGLLLRRSFDYGCEFEAEEHSTVGLIGSC